MGSFLLFLITRCVFAYHPKPPCASPRDILLCDRRETDGEEEVSPSDTVDPSSSHTLCSGDNLLSRCKSRPSTLSETGVCKSSDVFACVLYIYFLKISFFNESNPEMLCSYTFSHQGRRKNKKRSRGAYVSLPRRLDTPALDRSLSPHFVIVRHISARIDAGPCTKNGLGLHPSSAPQVRARCGLVTVACGGTRVMIELVKCLLTPSTRTLSLSNHPLVLFCYCCFYFYFLKTCRKFLRKLPSPRTQARVISLSIAIVKQKYLSRFL